MCVCLHVYMYPVGGTLLSTYDDTDLLFTHTLVSYIKYIECTDTVVHPNTLHSVDYNKIQ